MYCIKKEGTILKRVRCVISKMLGLIVKADREKRKGTLIHCCWRFKLAETWKIPWNFLKK
jgi:hypothetical protein